MVIKDIVALFNCLVKIQTVTIDSKMKLDAEQVSKRKKRFHDDAQSIDGEGEKECALRMQN